MQQLPSLSLERKATVATKAIDQDAQTVQVAFSSSEPVEDWPGVTLILSHKSGHVDLSRLNDGGAVLVNHRRDDQVGVVERAWVDDGKVGRAVLRFSSNTERAQAMFADVVDGIRRHVSVGADLSNAELVLIREDKDTGARTYEVRGWVPGEISLAAVPANHNIGVGREAPKPKPGAVKVTTETQQPDSHAVERARTEGAQATTDLVSRILDAGQQFECLDLAREAITSGWSYEQFSEKAVKVYFERQQKKLEEAGNPDTKPVTSLGLSAEEKRKYSISRAMVAVLDHKPALAPFEMECDTELRRILNKEPHGVFIPHDIQTRQYSDEALARMRELQVQRDMQTTGPGANIVGTRHSPENFIEQLRVNVVGFRAGARVLPNMRENLSIPRKTSGATFAWLAEGGNITLSDLGLDALTLTPKTVGGGTKSTRRLLLQSSPAIDDIIMQDLNEGAAEAVDLGMLEGTGAGNQPTGVVNTSGVLTQAVVAAGNPTLAEAMGFKTAIATANAARGNMVWVTTDAAVGNMSLRTLDSGSGRFLIDPVNPQGLLGRPYLTTNQITAGRIIHGNFAEILAAMWGVLDLMPDPYGAAAEGALIIRAWLDMDVGVRHPAAFCINA